MDERDDYADNDLPAERQWLRVLLVLLLVLGVLASLAVGLMLLVSMTLTRPPP